MAQDRHRDRGRRGGKKPPARRARYDDDYEDDEIDGPEGDDFDDEDDDDDYEEERPSRSRRPAAAPAAGRRGSRRPRPDPSSKRKRPSGKKPQRRGRVDFSGLDDEPEDDRGRRGRRSSRHEEAADPAPRRRRRRRKTLSDLCTPVFAYAAMLPSDESGPHPDYLTYREGAVSAVQKLEAQARDQGIDPQDAQDAAYALAAFLDEQVIRSSWQGRERWAQEPLNIVLSQDPDAGVNFWKRLDGLRGDQTEVKKVFLCCIALGFKGKWATEDPRVQVQKISGIKKKLFEEIHEVGMGDEEFLFPDAYEPSQPLEDEVEPAPPRWRWLSLAAVVLAVVIYLLLYYVAAGAPSGAEETLEALLNGDS